jgi:glutamyl endopeptidase
MDRRQMIVQRTRELFADRLDDVLPMLRQDRQEMRGWQEPAHVRAVVRRIIREGGGSTAEAVTLTSPEMEFGRAAAEPDRGQQREALGVLLEAAAAGLEKVARHGTPELTPEEAVGLECALLLYARPAVLVSEGRLCNVPPFWNLLMDQCEDIELAQRGVGRIELLGHPEFDWAGTGFLVNEHTLMTTRSIADLFIEERSGQWSFRPGISAWMDYRPEYQSVSTAGYRVRSVLGVHDVYDLALLEVEPPQVNGGAPAPLALAAQAPGQVEGRPVYLVGYPIRDARRNEPEMVTRVFRDVYNVKRVQPGLLRGQFRFHEVQLLRHDCAPLGRNAGACVVDLETHQVIGMHLSGRYLDAGTAVPLYVLRDDPLLQRHGVTFAEATSQDRGVVTAQLERLARSRYWAEARKVIGDLYQRAFGQTEPRR